MKNMIFKLLISIICIILTFSCSFVFAGTLEEAGSLNEFAENEKGSEMEKEEVVVKKITAMVLDIILWLAYAAALGSLVFVGIKYLTSGANERANLKGLVPIFLIGLAFIIFCFPIAKYIAYFSGNDEASEILKVGEQAGEMFTGITNTGKSEGEDEETENKENEENMENENNEE